MKFTDYDKETKLKKKDPSKDWILDFDMDASFLISEARIRMGMTQAQLAKLVGTKQSSIARMEGGSYLPSLGFLKKVALAIGTTLIPPQFGFMDNRRQDTVRYLPLFIGLESQQSSTKIVHPEVGARTIINATS